MSKLDTVVNQLNKARARVEVLEAQYAELRLAELRKVETSKTGDTVTLKYGSRVLKAKKHPRYNRWNVFEGRKKIVTEYMAGIHDLRFDIACGRI
jgi:hypothetical protein